MHKAKHNVEKGNRTMTNQDKEKMVLLAREGKRISKICKEDFQDEYTYDDVYFEVYAEGERSAMGVKRMISNRLKKLSTLSPQEQEKMIEEIDDHVWYLYSRYKESQTRIEDIRNIIEG